MKENGQHTKQIKGCVPNAQQVQYPQTQMWQPSSPATHEHALHSMRPRLGFLNYACHRVTSSAMIQDSLRRGGWGKSRGSPETNRRNRRKTDLPSFRDRLAPGGRCLWSAERGQVLLRGMAVRSLLPHYGCMTSTRASSTGPHAFDMGHAVAPQSATLPGPKPF